MTEPTELLPCPFCGGSVELEETTSYYNEMHGNRHWWGVVCRNTTNRGGSCAIQQRPSASKEAAVERWNRRTPQPTQAQAGAVPLTDKQARELVELESWGPDAISLNAQLLRTIRRTEAAHGIQGGQHGAE